MAMFNSYLCLQKGKQCKQFGLNWIVRGCNDDVMVVKQLLQVRAHVSEQSMVIQRAKNWARQICTPVGFDVFKIGGYNMIYLTLVYGDVCILVHTFVKFALVTKKL